MPPGRSDGDAAVHAEAHAWATEWAQRWFLGPDGTDRFTLDGTDAGWATHVEAYLILFDVGASLLGIEARSRFSARRWLKARGYDRALRAAALRRLPRPVPARHPIGIVVEIPTPSMTEPARAVAAAAGSQAAVAVADPRAARGLAGPGRPVLPLVLPWADERRVVAAATRSLRDSWADLVARPPRIRLRERDVTGEVLAGLSPLVRRSMPYLAAERLAVERFIEATQAEAVAIASDQHRLGRLVAAAARRRGVRSVVLQHGLPQSPIGYLPVVADAVAAWSAASAAWFVDRGTDPARIVVTGNPRLDGGSRVSAPRSRGARVLLALSPTAPATNAALVRDVLAATARMTDAELTVKLHPGQSDWSFVASLVREAGLGRRVSVRRHEALAPLLAAATVVVVHRSSVAVEALAMGRPVIVHRAGEEPTTADLELAELHLAVTDDVAGLIEAAGRLSASDAAATYLAARAEAIEHVAGPLDGGGAERIVRLLLAGAQ